MLGFLTRRRRNAPDDRLLWACAEEIPLLGMLPPIQRQRAVALAAEFLKRKSIEGAAGLETDQRMLALIALQAVLPVLELGLDLYQGWYSVVVYPDDFLAPYEFVDDAGVVHQGGRVLSGESWQHGPVILAWSHVEQDALDPEPAGNVVIHELAHKLDLLNGAANGMPPLHREMSPAAWSRTLEAAYQDLQEHLDRNEEPPIDPYAGQSPGEFFAVASELFFAWPESLLHAYPEVFSQLARYYRRQYDANGWVW